MKNRFLQFCGSESHYLKHVVSSRQQPTAQSKVPTRNRASHIFTLHWYPGLWSEKTTNTHPLEGVRSVASDRSASKSFHVSPSEFKHCSPHPCSLCLSHAHSAPAKRELFQVEAFREEEQSSDSSPNSLAASRASWCWPKLDQVCLFWTPQGQARVARVRAACKILAFWYF